jgi:hypothetical protein
MKKLLNLYLFIHLAQLHAVLPHSSELHIISIIKEAIKPMKHDYNSPVPEDIKQILDAHASEIAELPRDMTKMPSSWLDGYVIKPGHGRIEGAKQFAQAINELNTKKVFVPKKYAYVVPKEHIKNYWDSGNRTISEYIPFSDEPITKNDLKEVMRVAKKLQWIDSHSGNLRKTLDGRMAIIDTKKDYINAGTLDPARFHEREIKWAIVHKLTKFPLPLTSEASEYLTQKHAQYNPWHHPYNPEQEAIRKKWLPYKRFMKNFQSNFVQQSAFSEMF